MYNKTVSEISKDLVGGKYSSVELLRCFMSRIKEFDSKLNSFITVTEEIALKDAQRADADIKQKKFKPLLGIPIVHKDLFCTKGVKTTCASKMLENFISPYDATVVEKLKEAGTVMLGKTNMDEFAMGASNENSFYGPVHNPWNLELVSGGSSGGSAAAVAARLIPVATGTDTGGSIRQPAAFCNLTGIKPTYGLVSRFGMVAFASSLDQAGPMTKNAEDTALLLNAMVGFDPKDSTSIKRPDTDYTTTLNDNLDGLTIGLPKEYFDEGLNTEIALKIDEAIAQLGKLGVKFKEISLSCNRLAVPAYYIIAPAEASSNLSRFDGVRFGYRCKNPKNIDELYDYSRSEGFGDEVKRRIMIGTYVLSSGFYDAFYSKAQRVRRKIAEDFKNAFKDVDLILGPATATPAFKINQKKHDVISMYLTDMYTCAVNLAGLPAISVPTGFMEGLPVGMQLIGDHFAEGRLLNVAHQYQKVTDWHKQVPGGFIG